MRFGRIMGIGGWMERNLIEEKSREWMEEREKAGNTYVVTRGFADVMRGARVQSRMLETLGRGVFLWRKWRRRRMGIAG